jgi:hypothetical protein
VVALLACAGDSPAVTLFLTTAGDAKLGVNALTFKEGDIVAYDTDTQVASLFFSRWNFRQADGDPAGGVNVDALHVLSDGRIYLSPAATARLGSNLLLIEDGDVALYDPIADTATMVFLGDSKSTTIKGLFRTSGGALGADEDVDALYVMPDGTLLLSTRGDARLGSNVLSFTAGDVVQYDPLSDTASLYFDHMNFLKTDNVTAGGPGNIDALALLAGGQLLLSTSDTARLGSPVLKFEHGDLVLYDPLQNSASIYLDQDVFLKQCGGSNVDGLSLLSFGDDLDLIPEPLTCGTLVLGVGALVRYTRRRMAR